MNVFKAVPQILKNVKVKSKKIINSKEVKKAIKEAEKNLFIRGRILVRKSGTEPIIRVMGESHDYEVLKHNVDKIVSTIKYYS